MSTPGFAVFIGGYNLSDAGESINAVGNFVCEVDDEVRLPLVRWVCADRDRCCHLAVAEPGNVVRHETSVPKCPEQFVHDLRRRKVCDLDINGVLVPVCLFSETAGEALPRRVTAAGDHIKVYACHWLIRVKGRRAIAGFLSAKAQGDR